VTFSLGMYLTRLFS